KVGKPLARSTSTSIIQASTPSKVLLSTLASTAVPFLRPLSRRERRARGVRGLESQTMATRIFVPRRGEKTPCCISSTPEQTLKNPPAGVKRALYTPKVHEG